MESHFSGMYRCPVQLINQLTENNKEFNPHELITAMSILRDSTFKSSAPAKIFAGISLNIVKMNTNVMKLNRLCYVKSFLLTRLEESIVSALLEFKKSPQIAEIRSRKPKLNNSLAVLEWPK